MFDATDLSELEQAFDALEKGPETHLYGEGAVYALEEKLKAWYDMPFALCVSNATMGLLAIGMALGIRDKTYVTTPFTYGGTIAGWQLLGNKPVFADIHPETLALTPATVKAVDDNAAAILAVDTFGIPCDTRRLRKLADDLGIWYIADAAQSFGARRDGIPASAHAHALVVSFGPGKTLFAGEGGAILTDNETLYKKLVWYTQHPYRQRRDISLSTWNEIGLNGRMHPLAAYHASRRFEAALATLEQRQTRLSELTHILNASGLVVPCNFDHKHIQPAYFRHSATWKQEARIEDLKAFVAGAGYNIEITPSPLSLVYAQPAFQAAYGEVADGRCAEAEKQFARRFCVHLEA